jgi:hypothetical protein
MKLNEIYLSERESEMLAEILEVYNRDVPLREQKSFQELAEELLKDAIFFKCKSLRSSSYGKF